jgi:hypothetical protein
MNRRRGGNLTPAPGNRTRPAGGTSPPAVEEVARAEGDDQGHDGDHEPGRKARNPKRNEYNISVALRETHYAVRNLPALSPPVHRSNATTAIDGASEETLSETPTDRRSGDVPEVQRLIRGEDVSADDGWHPGAPLRDSEVTRPAEAP